MARDIVLVTGDVKGEALGKLELQNLIGEMWI